ncbi:MAG: hypothetical protein NC928_00815 [Candidatus Omnitrophica bacterium]|nr:hypothetical protein [Candidatus Omnitrophota bacterium]
MPTYEYECKSCGYRFEAFQKITDKPLEMCPRCNCEIKRLISSGAGLIFKGSGFYVTDYRKRQATDTRKGDSNCPAAQKGCNACQASQ